MRGGGVIVPECLLNCWLALPAVGWQMEFLSSRLLCRCARNIGSFGPIR